MVPESNYQTSKDFSNLLSKTSSNLNSTSKKSQKETLALTIENAKKELSQTRKQEGYVNQPEKVKSTKSIVRENAY